MVCQHARELFRQYCAWRTVFQLIAFACISALIAGCSEFQTVQDPDSDETLTTIRIGDTIQIITADVEKYEFEVVNMDDAAFHGEEVRIPYSDVRILSVKRVSTSRALGLVMVFALTAGGIQALGSAAPPPIP